MKKTVFLDLKNNILIILASIISYLIYNYYENKKSNKDLISTTIMAMTDKISEISKDLVKFSKIIDETKKIEELHNFIKENNSFDFAVGIDGALMKLD